MTGKGRWGGIEGEGCAGRDPVKWDGVKYCIITLPRETGIDYPGLTHHIMVRTFNDLVLSRDDFDRDYYFSCLSHRIKEIGFTC